MESSRLVVAVATVLVLGSGCASSPSGSAAAPGTTTPAPATTATAASTEDLPGRQDIPTAAAVVPTRVVIPAIGVDASDLEALHRAATTEELDAPVDFTRAGYYAEGPAPGDPGPAVVAAHVDDRSGPKVFYRLRELTPGDTVSVTRSDGRTVEFRVDAVEQYPKDDFPTEAVYGPQPGASLRLITCGGSFDESVRSYRDNIVVYASETDGNR